MANNKNNNQNRNNNQKRNIRNNNNRGNVEFAEEKDNDAITALKNVLEKDNNPDNC